MEMCLASAAKDVDTVCLSMLVRKILGLYFSTVGTAAKGFAGTIQIFAGDHNGSSMKNNGNSGLVPFHTHVV